MKKVIMILMLLSIGATSFAQYGSVKPVASDTTQIAVKYIFKK